MKKLVAVLLSLLMIFSAFSVVGFAADDKESEGGSLLDSVLGSIDYGALAGMFEEHANFDFADLIGDEFEGLIGKDGIDMEAVIANEYLAKNISFLGYSIYELYSGTPVFWAKVANTTGEESIKGDFSILKANINTYLLSVLKNKIGPLGSVDFYTAENATSLTNFIGKLLNPDWENVTLTGNAYSTADSFYSAVADISGLSNIIQLNWIDANVNYGPLLTALSFNFDDDDLLGKYNKEKGNVVAKILVKTVITRALEKGPLEYMLEAVSQIASSYNLLMYPAIEALFMSHITRGTIEKEELKTMKGLFNLIANGNKVATDEIQFIDVPLGTFGSTYGVFGNNSKSSTDTTDMFFYMVIYLNLVGKHKNNSIAVQIFRNEMVAGLEGSEKDIVGAIIGAMMLGDFGTLFSYFAEIFMQNVSSVPGNIFNGIGDFFANIINSIAKIIERIINSFLHFGQF